MKTKFKITIESEEYKDDEPMTIEVEYPVDLIALRSKLGTGPIEDLIHSIMISVRGVLHKTLINDYEQARARLEVEQPEG